MKIEQILLIVALLLCISTKSYAQREDTLRLSAPKPTGRFPSTGAPLDVKDSSFPMLSGKLGIDDLEFSIATKDTTIAPQHLTSNHYMQLYRKEYLAWQKKTYGNVIDLQKFVYRKRRPGELPLLAQGKKAAVKPNDVLMSVLPPHLRSAAGASLSIGISYPLSKSEKWFRKQFDFTSRTYGLDYYLDTLKLRLPEEQRFKAMVDSIVQAKKLREAHFPDSIKPLKVKRRFKEVYW